MRTAQEVFDIAIRLMDAQNESTGSTRTADTYGALGDIIEFGRFSSW